MAAKKTKSAKKSAPKTEFVIVQGNREICRRPTRGSAEIASEHLPPGDGPVSIQEVAKG